MAAKKSALVDVDFRSATLDYTELLKVVRLMTRDQRAGEEMFRRVGSLSYPPKIGQ